MDAKIIIADEPTGALDSENTDSLMDLLLELNRQGITIIIVSHDPKVAMRCPIRYRIEDGRIEWVYLSPENCWVYKNYHLKNAIDEDYKKLILTNAKIKVYKSVITEKEVEQIIKENKISENIDNVIWYLYSKMVIQF